jgi:predicted HicB family RNase H-like nuclease
MTRRKRLDLRIDPKLSEELKKACGETGVSQTEFISQAIRAKIGGDSAQTIIEQQFSFLIEKLAKLDRKMEARFDELHNRHDEIIAALEKRSKNG